MDDRRFDGLARSLATRHNRRSALKALLGLGSLAAVGAIARDEVQAARRGEPAQAPTPRATVPSAPPISTNTAVPVPPTATASCAGVVCSGLCCDGQCTTTGACCPAGSTVCGPDCCPNGQATCCDNACCYGACYGEELCCPTGQIACNGVCLPLGGCCTNADCPGARCLEHVCVSSPPTEAPPPTATATATPACREDADCGACTCGSDGGEIGCPSCFDGTCEFVTAFCPDGTRCVDGACRGFTPTSTSTATATPTATDTGTATNTTTPTNTSLPARVDVAITPTCFPQAIVSGFPPSYSIPEVRFLAKRADGSEFSLGTYAHQFSTDGDGNVIATGTAPIVNSAAEIRATASIGSEVYTSGFIVKTCSITQTPTHTPTGTATESPTSTATATPSPTRTATPVPPSMTSFMLALIDRCYVVVNLSGFPPNSRVDFSMLAMRDGLVWKFLDDQYYNDVPIDEHGNLKDYVMGPVWVEPDPRDPFAVITVSPIAYSPAADLYASADFLELQAVCNPD